MKAPKKVFIYGGTHGNEWTGVFIVNKYADEIKKQFPELDLHFVLANPEAYKINRRFVHEDLNRAFQFLDEDRKDSFENQRARVLKEQVKAEPCIVLDLHTTTSNMGRTVLITRDHPLNFHLANNLSKHLPDVKIIQSFDSHRKYLASQSDFGMIIEVGAVTNGVINAAILQGTLEIIKDLLSSLRNLPTELKGEIEIYEEIEDCYYPKSENEEIAGFIHAEFQGRDFRPIEGKYKAFTTFTGENIELETKEKLYPIFINEAAYYPKLLAFTLCRKKKLSY